MITGLFTAAAITAAVTALWKIKPTQAVIRFLVRSFVRPIREMLHAWVAFIVLEETTDLRKAVYPDGGSSLQEKLDRVRYESAITREIVASMKERLDKEFPPGDTEEIPMRQPKNLQV